jgi:hypothetical protein
MLKLAFEEDDEYFARDRAEYEEKLRKKLVEGANKLECKENKTRET